MAATGPDSPRQKMINLMYILLLAMLALNVSSDVLKGFGLVEESLLRSTRNTQEQNKNIYNSFDQYLKDNPEKVRTWFEKAQFVRTQSDSLYNYVEQLKVMIAREADGDDADVHNIENKEDLEAASFVMLSPRTGQGKRLQEAVDRYRETILQFVADSTQRDIIARNMSTAVPRKSTTVGKNWAEYLFESTPVAAAVTLLTKLQNDIRHAEGEVLHTLVSNIDVNDFRVNQLDAFVIPSSQTIVRGGKFSARIVMAAIDTTQRPAIYIGGRPLPDARNGLYETICDRTGDFTLSGFLEIPNASGQVYRREFSHDYRVIDPAATVSATLMNVLYAGYANPVSVSVPGIPSEQVQLSVDNGTLTRSGADYICTPSSIGEAKFTVSALIEGRSQVMGEYTFRVRQLPDPQPFIEYDDNGVRKRYRGGRGFPKGVLLGCDGIVAAIDDGLLNVEFKVLSFETTFYDNMGNAVPEISDGSKFSAQQMRTFRSLSRGKRFYISRVRAIGPDGIERTLPTALEVIVN
ncbi:MAG: gliding motility protein GldM [Bacteroidaceae bacterium]|jgi:gliding motility-associated protein GldM